MSNIEVTGASLTETISRSAPFSSQAEKETFFKRLAFRMEMYGHLDEWLSPSSIGAVAYAEGLIPEFQGNKFRHVLDTAFTNRLPYLSAPYMICRTRMGELAYRFTKSENLED